jgi:uncharacterized protein
VSAPAEPILPTLTAVNARFWDACREGRLELQRCGDCGHLLYPIAPLCPSCLGSALTWEPLSGRGSIFALMVFRRGYHPWWAERVPYAVALVELDEGPRMFGDLPDADVDALAVGQPVEVYFDRTGELAIPRFRVTEPL